MQLDMSKELNKRQKSIESYVSISRSLYSTSREIENNPSILDTCIPCNIHASESLMLPRSLDSIEIKEKHHKLVLL